MSRLILVASLLLLYWTGAFGGISPKALQCICNVESNCNPNIGCRMDVGSLSCGPFQIKLPYYKDCYQPGSDWKSCTNTIPCSEKCVIAYTNRYGKYCTGGRVPTDEDYARIHNGGPKGCQKQATMSYWKKIKACCLRGNGSCNFNGSRNSTINRIIL